MVITGLPDTDKNFGMALFPNPVKDELKLNLPDLQDATAEVSIYDMTGRKWISRSVASNTMDVINVSDLTAGAYILRIKIGQQGVFNQRFIKL